MTKACTEAAINTIAHLSDSDCDVAATILIGTRRSLLNGCRMNQSLSGAGVTRCLAGTEQIGRVLPAITALFGAMCEDIDGLTADEKNLVIARSLAVLARRIPSYSGGLALCKRLMGRKMWAEVSALRSAKPA